jgi:hypothetical protein
MEHRNFGVRGKIRVWPGKLVRERKLVTIEKVVALFNSRMKLSLFP